MSATKYWFILASLLLHLWSMQSSAAEAWAPGVPGAAPPGGAISETPQTESGVPRGAVRVVQELGVEALTLAATTADQAEQRRAVQRSC